MTANELEREVRAGGGLRAQGGTHTPTTAVHQQPPPFREPPSPVLRPLGQVLPQTLAERDAEASDLCVENFWSLVLKTQGCWLWAGARDRDGYGFYSEAEVRYIAHRVAYEVAVGPIPAGFQIDHLCRRRWCVNPDHLEPVTAAENIRRARPFRRLFPVPTCKRGHEFTPENTRVTAEGRRRCRICVAANSRERRASRARRDATT